jgi:hypothetical protein
MKILISTNKDNTLDVLKTTKSLMEYFDTFHPRGEVLEHWSRIARMDLERMYNEILECRASIDKPNIFKRIINRIRRRSEHGVSEKDR